MPTQSLLTLSTGQSQVTTQGSESCVIPLGPDQIAQAVFRQSPPYASQLETAINMVEDAIMASGLRKMPRGTLVAKAGPLYEALSPTHMPAQLSLAQVERRYQDIAMPAQRLPTAPVLEIDPLALSALIFVRELMHHLGYSDLALE
jgi:hypothetical protein